MANPIENVAAKAMGTVKAVKAGFNGLRGVFLHLAQEHGEVGELMRHVANWPTRRRKIKGFIL